MIKAIIFDIDGVVLRKRNKYFSERLIEEGRLEDCKDEILSFFKNDYKLCMLGKADLKQELAKRLGDWGWKKSVDDLLDYWFSFENKLNQEVLELVRELREKGIKCYMASDHTEYRADNLMKEVGLGSYFDGAFFSCFFGCSKSGKEFFEKVLQQLEGIEALSVMFWDNEEENVEAAKSLGIQALLFEGAQAAREVLIKEGVI